MNGASAFTANQARGCRVIAPKGGTHTDLTTYIQSSSGNLDIGIYDTAGTRAAQYRTGSVVAPAAGWAVLAAAPAITTSAHEQHDLVIAPDNGTMTFGRAATSLSTTAGQLPTGFWAADGGALPKLAWSAITSFPLPASFTEATCVAATFTAFAMTRIA